MRRVVSLCVSHWFHQGKASFRRCDRRSSAIDEGVEHSNTAVACLQNIRAGIAVGLTGKSASPTTHPDIVHRLDIANHCVAVFRDTLTYFRRSLIDCRNADQSAPRVYPDAIFRISVAHHTFALHGIELDEDFIEVVAQQFCGCHLFFSMFLFADSRTSDLDGADELLRCCKSDSRTPTRYECDLSLQLSGSSSSRHGFRIQKRPENGLYETATIVRK